jgi:eukaryotic-like serine/threonine-protein kinase
MGNATQSAVPSVVYRFGLFALDAASGTLTRSGIRVRLQDQPFQLLVLLVRRSGQVVSREDIQRHLWPGNTFVDFDKSLGVAVLKAREALGDDADNPRFIETVPRRGYRFLAPVQTEGLAHGVVRVTAPADAVEKAAGRRVKSISAIAALAAIFILGVGVWLKQTRARIPEHAAVVVGDFSNNTGDPLFDGSLRRAVVIQLAQSPYLSVVSDQKLGDILQDIGRSPDDTLTPGLAREVCQRGQAVALITGSIRSSGGAYHLSMEADRCSDGGSLASKTLRVENKQQVVPGLGTMVDEFRRKLGESRESLQKFNVPVEQATTSSLEALKAYQLGLELRAHSKNLEARPAFKTAIALDPNFAIAYAQLGSAYSNLGNTAEAKPYFQKAFELRARATEPERLYITGRYFDIVTGELEKGSETYKLWTELYPNEWKPYNAVANDAYLMGRYETVVDAARQAVRLGPNQDFASDNLIAGLIGLNRIDEAKKICEQLIAQGHDNTFIHLDLFAIAYLQQDESAVGRELEWAQKHPNAGDMIYARAEAAAAMGKVKESTRLFEQSAKLDVANGDLESAANVLAIAAEINSEMGWSAIAQRKSEDALKLGKNEIVLGLGSLIAARAHNLRRAQELLSELDHDYPLSTFNLGVYSPMIRTTMAAPGSSSEQITHLMEPALPYELGFEADLLPMYVRGESYLEIHATEEAEREFQKLLDHHFVDAVTTLYPLSQLALARVYTLEGRKADSRKAYEQFFSLWKDADKDLPILLKARREFHGLN